MNHVCRTLAGDAVTGILLSAIVQAFLQETAPKIQRCGLYWILKTREEWMADTGLTLNQYRRAISVLKTKDLVEVRVMKHEGVARGHVRLLQPIARFLPVQTGKSSGWVVLTQPNVLNSIDLVGTVYSGSGGTSSASTHDQKYTGKEQEGSTEKEKRKVGTGGARKPQSIRRGWFMKAEDILKAQQQPTTGSLGAYWKSRCALATGKYQHPLTGKESAQLKQLHAYLGTQTRPVIDYVVEHWWKFANRAAAAAGCSCPTDPHIGFLLKHHAVAVELLTPAEVIPPATGVLEGPVQLVATGAETDPVQTLTSNELTELLDGLKSP